MKLNLIDTGDPLSPQPLNENAEKLEAKFTALDTADAAQQLIATALDTRVTALEVHKIAVGTYRGATAPNIIRVGFTPAAVLVSRPGDSSLAMCVTGRGHCTNQTSSPLLEIIPEGFCVNTNSYIWGDAGTLYNYVALA